MPRYKLRTLLLLLAILPPLLAVGWWRYEMWRAEQQRRRREWSLNGQRIWIDTIVTTPLVAVPDEPAGNGRLKAGKFSGTE